MCVPMDVEVDEIRDCVGRAVSRHLACANEPPQPLGHFDVDEMRRVEFFPVPEEPFFDPGAKRSLQQELQYGRRVDDNHADSRSSRMTTAARVFKVTRFRPWILASISSRVGRTASRSSSASR